MNEEIRRIVRPHQLAGEWNRQGWQKGEELFNGEFGALPEGNGLIQDFSLYQELRQSLNRKFDTVYKVGALTVLAPVGAFGLVEGFAAPDWDISLMGIGYHRYFLFHSAFGLILLRRFYRQWQLRALESQPGWGGKVKQKIAGTLFGTVAAGVGLHLLTDVFQPKSVVFPFFGSLVDGTLVDDNIWLLGNSLWAFRISHEVFSLVLADELNMAKEYAGNHFSALKNWKMKEA